MKLLVLSGILSATLTGACLAADVVSEPPPVESDYGWRFQATAYGWLAGLDGDIGIRGLPPADVSVSPFDAFDHLDAIPVMGSLLAKNDKWLFLGDIIWVKLSDQATGPFGGTINAEQTQLTASALVGYRLPFALPPDVELYATVGVRYQHLKARLDVSPVIVPITVSREGTKEWADPTIGLNLHYDINDRWFVNALADIGGFGVSSNLTAQGFASVGYMWTPSISTAVGYRAIYTDFKDGGFVYNATQHGLFSSIAFHF